MRTALGRILRNFHENRRGTFATTMAILTLPLVFGVGLGVDYTRAVTVQAHLQNALDAAMLTAAQKRSTTELFDPSKVLPEKYPDWYNEATRFFEATLSETASLSLKTAPKPVFNAGNNNEIHGAVSAQLVLTIGSIAMETMELRAEAKVKASRLPKPVCLLSLNPSADQALAINGTADIMAKGCTIRVNSSSSTAMTQVGNSSVTAQGICVNGNYTGANYNPGVDRGCHQMKDPLISQFLIDVAATDTTSCDQHDDTKPLTFAKGTSWIDPGVYCGGMLIGNGETAQLQSGGVYVIRDGALEVKAGGTLRGENVTILLAGQAEIVIQAQGNLDLKAKSSGTFKSIAIAQLPDSTTFNKGNLVIGGGSVEMEGLIYFPGQKIKITGSGDISLDSDLFAIIADQVEVEGNGQLNIGTNVDFVASGLPSLPIFNELVSVRLTD